MTMAFLQNNNDHDNKKGSTFQSAEEVIQCVTEFYTARLPPL